jgi:hypothetical protein
METITVFRNHNKVVHKATINETVGSKIPSREEMISSGVAKK